MRSWQTRARELGLGAPRQDICNKEDQSECSIWGGGGAKDVKNQSKSKKEELTMKRTNQNTAFNGKD